MTGPLPIFLLHVQQKTRLIIGLFNLVIAVLIFYPIHVHNLSHVIVCVSCCNTDEIFSQHGKSDFSFASNLTIQSGDISEYSDLQSPKYVSIDYKEGKTTLQRCEKHRQFWECKHQREGTNSIVSWFNPNPIPVL